MKYKVQLFVGGNVFDFICFATSNQDANRVAKAQHPNARIISTTAVFRWFAPFRMTCEGSEKIGQYDCTSKNQALYVFLWVIPDTKPP